MIVEDRSIFLRTQNEQYYGQMNDIICLSADGRYTNVLFKDGRRIFIAKQLKIFENEFSLDIFYRCHRSHLINLLYVEEINLKKTSVKLGKGMLEVPISKKNKKEFISKVLKIFQN